MPVSMAIPVRASIENIKAPMAQIPIVTPISIAVGKYSEILPHGPGIKTGNDQTESFFNPNSNK